MTRAAANWRVEPPEPIGQIGGQFSIRLCPIPIGKECGNFCKIWHGFPPLCASHCKAAGLVGQAAWGGQSRRDLPGGMMHPVFKSSPCPCSFCRPHPTAEARSPRTREGVSDAPQMSGPLLFHSWGIRINRWIHRLAHAFPTPGKRLKSWPQQLASTLGLHD
jgi:hypothetical protein